MADSQSDIRHLVAQLRTRHFRRYLLSCGWEEKASRYAEHCRFEVLANDGVDSFVLDLPMSADTRDYRSRIMRVLYKLSGIEDREPHEIAESVLACIGANESESESSEGACLKIRNSGHLPLQVEIDAPARKHELLPGEAVELNCVLSQGNLLEIDRTDAGLLIRAVARK